MANLTTAQYAKFIGVSQRTVQRWIKDGQILATREGRKYLVDEEQQPQTPNVSTPDENKTAERADVDRLSTKEYAKFIGVSQRTVQRWIKDGTLTATRQGKRYIVEVAQTVQPDTNPFTPESVNVSDDDDFPMTDENIYPKEARRKDFSTYEEAVNYANKIPVPTLIIKNQFGYFRVIVRYDVIEVVESQDNEDEPQ